MTAEETLVFDTGPLSHFAEQGWLGALRAVVGKRRAVAPDTVVAELRNGCPGRPHLEMVLKAGWLEQHNLTGDDEVLAFTKFAGLLVAKGRNTGEAGVLAYAKAHNATAILDDGPARKAAKTHGIKHTGTLGLLCEAIRAGLLTVELVSTLADHLIEGEYRLPFPPGGFQQWTSDHDVLG